MEAWGNYTSIKTQTSTAMKCHALSVQVLTHAGSWHLLHPTLFGHLTPQSAPGGTCNLETSWWAPCDVPCPSCHPYQNFESHKVCLRLHSFFLRENGHCKWTSGLIHSCSTHRSCCTLTCLSIFCKASLGCHAFWGFQICFQGFSGCMMCMWDISATSTSSRIHTPHPLGLAMAAEDAPPGLQDAGLGANRKRMGHPAGWAEIPRPTRPRHVSFVSCIWKLQDPPSTKQNMTGLYLDWWHHQSSIHKIGSCEGQPAVAFKLKQHVQTCGKIFRNLCLKRLM